MKKSAAIFVFILGAGILASGTAYKIHDIRQQTVETSREAPASRYLSLGTPFTFQDGSTLVVTTPVTKTDPTTATGSAFILTEAGDATAYGYVPFMDLGTDKAYAVTRLYDLDSGNVNAVSVDFDPDDDEVWIHPIEEYAYLQEDADASTLLSLYEDQYRQKADFSVEQVENGRVDFSVSSSSGEDEYLSGTVQICFMNEDTCVFADTIDYESPHEKDRYFEMTYRIPYQLPEYISIKFINLY